MCRLMHYTALEISGSPPMVAMRVCACNSCVHIYVYTHAMYMRTALYTCAYVYIYIYMSVKIPIEGVRFNFPIVPVDQKKELFCSGQPL